MSRITLITPTDATGPVEETLAEIKSAFGVVPNMFRAVANSPAALASMWGSFGALGGGRLGARLGGQIAVAIADRKNCNYCLAAHTVLGEQAGASAEEMAEAQLGRSTDPRTHTALAYAIKVVDARAGIAAADVDALRTAGFDDGELVEIIAHVALDVPVDFPAVELKRAA